MTGEKRQMKVICKDETKPNKIKSGESAKRKKKRNNQFNEIDYSKRILNEINLAFNLTFHRGMAESVSPWNSCDYNYWHHNVAFEFNNKIISSMVFGCFFFIVLFAFFFFETPHNDITLNNNTFFLHLIFHGRCHYFIMQMVIWCWLFCLSTVFIHLSFVSLCFWIDFPCTIINFWF